MKEVKFDGVGKMSGGTFEDVSFDGVSECTGSIICQKITIDGVFTCSGGLDAARLCVDGVAEFKANIKAKTINIDGVFNASKVLKIEADEIMCDGTMEGKSEISADKITVDGYIRAKEIVGDSISITSRIGILWGLFLRKHSAADLIEATTIHLKGVHAKKVSGTNITIGPKCVIDIIDCNGTLSVDPTAKVGKTTGVYKYA